VNVFIRYPYITLEIKCCPSEMAKICSCVSSLNIGRTVKCSEMVVVYVDHLPEPIKQVALKEVCKLLEKEGYIVTTEQPL
jgi:hypothetical protein